MSSHSLSLLAALMILMTLLTTTHCIINTTTITSNSSRCDGGSTDDPSCLIGEIDLDSEEFTMDSEISRRTLADNLRYSKTALNPGQAATRCDRNGKECHSGPKNLKPPPPRCGKAIYDRECFMYRRK